MFNDWDLCSSLLSFLSFKERQSDDGQIQISLTNADCYQLLIFDVSINFCPTFCFSGRPVGENGKANQEVKKK